MLATALGVTRTEHEDTQVTWRFWRAERLLWARPPALILLQGGNVNRILGDRYILLCWENVPQYDPLPRLENIVLAETLRAPESWNRDKLALYLFARLAGV